MLEYVVWHLREESEALLQLQKNNFVLYYWNKSFDVFLLLLLVLNLYFVC